MAGRTLGIYRKRPVEVEAVQLTWRGWGDVCALLGDCIADRLLPRAVPTFSEQCGECPEYIELTIPTREGPMIARHGDWIIRGVMGELYPCKPEIFEATYDLVALRDPYIEYDPKVPISPRGAGGT